MAIQRTICGDQTNVPEFIVGYIDGYFAPFCSYFGGRRMEVLPGQAEQCLEQSYSFFSSVKKCLIVGSYFTGIIPISLLGAKIVLSPESFRILDARPRGFARGCVFDRKEIMKVTEATKELQVLLREKILRDERLRYERAEHDLEEGIEIPQEVIENIRMLMPKILNKEEDPAIERLGTNATHVFALKAAPHLVFKIGGASARWKNMIKSKAVCTFHQLDLLVIPKAKLLEVDGFFVLAEERINIHRDEDMQEQLFLELANGLDETVKQLAVFITKTGFRDVIWRNIPLVDAEPEFTGSRRLALIDFEEMNERNIGLFGGWGRRGLINCLFSEKQIDIVLKMAREYDILPFSLSSSSKPSPAQIKEERMQAIEIYRQNHLALKQYYASRGISERNGSQFIQVVDWAALGLNLEETRGIFDYNEGRWRDITMREAVCYVIDQINLVMSQKPADDSLRVKRYIFLDINDNKFLFSLSCYNSYYRDDQGRLVPEDPWLLKIVKALEKNGYIFKLDKCNGYGYYIQA